MDLKVVTAEMVLNVLKSFVSSNVIIFKRNPLCLVENVLSHFTQPNWRGSFVLQSWKSLFGQNAYQNKFNAFGNMKFNGNLTEQDISRAALPSVSVQHCLFFIPALWTSVYSDSSAVSDSFTALCIVCSACIWVILKVFSADVVNSKLKVFISNLTTSLL